MFISADGRFTTLSRRSHFSEADIPGIRIRDARRACTLGTHTSTDSTQQLTELPRPRAEAFPLGWSVRAPEHLRRLEVDHQLHCRPSKCSGDFGPQVLVLP